MLNCKDAMVEYCINNGVRRVSDLAIRLNQTDSMTYKLLRKLGIVFKDEIKDIIDFNVLLKSEDIGWIESCGEQYQEVRNDNWVPYAEDIEFGESGCRRKVVNKVFRGIPYKTYRFIPDEDSDEYLWGSNSAYMTDIEYKYVFISPNGVYHHSNNLRLKCEELGVPHHIATDSVYKKSYPLSGWVIRKTEDHYAN